ncbi:MAG TPA: N-succinylarginine dihydrolase [Myxococcales bacterium]|nr:N-succinylarginine dihydrolase [Myxococcales bacterium]
MPAREYNFDGLVGPTHNYAGLSRGNVASTTHAGQPASPRAAALQGLEKMRFVASLGVGQGVLPPHERPSLRTLRRLGFRGSDEEVIAQASRDPELKDQVLRISSSAAAMWTANAATCIPSADAQDRRLHLVPANLTAMFHRSLEADTTTRVLRAIFADAKRFEVHDPLPGGAPFADEGAANHTRLFVEGRPAAHLFAWGRRAFGGPSAAGEPVRYPARQTREASHALARLGQVDSARALFPQQHPKGIDAGAFHTDVLAVGNGNVLLLHEYAFVDRESLFDDLRLLLGEGIATWLATDAELPVASAVAAYPFNSQLLTLPDGSMTIVAPEEAREDRHARSFLQRVVQGGGPVKSVHHLDLRQSMENGGGPACLRQRIVLEDAERRAVKARVLWDDALGAELEAWVRKHYRDRLTGPDLSDPLLARETMAALDELTKILRLGSVYDFQR